MRSMDSRSDSLAHVGAGWNKAQVREWLHFLVLFALLYCISCFVAAPLGGESNLVVYIWKKLLDFFPEWVLITFGSWFSFLDAFWTSGLLLLYVDITKRPALIHSSKIQSSKDPSTDMAKIWKTIWTAAVNVVFINLLISPISYFLFMFRGQQISVEDLPSVQYVVLDLVAFTLFHEVVFYCTHRLFHQRFFYGRFHKQHHEWNAPIGIAAMYAHPIEHIICNVIPVMVGPVIMGSHLITVWLWYALAALATVNSHCGYRLPYVPSPEAHDFHHCRFYVNYGSFGWMDYIFGTDKSAIQRVYKEKKQLSRKRNSEKKFKTPKSSLVRVQSCPKYKCSGAVDKQIHLNQPPSF